MASPQAENGFVMVANDLFFAIMHAIRGADQAAVLSVILEQQYGARKLPSARVSTPELSKTLDIQRTHLYRAIRQLCESNIIVKVGPEEYRFNKDYESWTRGDKPLLSLTTVAFCGSQSRRSRVAAETNGGLDVRPTVVTASDQQWSQNETNDGHSVTNGGHKERPTVVTHSDQRWSQPVTNDGHTAYKDRAPGDFQKTSEEITHTHTAGTNARDSSQVRAFVERIVEMIVGHYGEHERANAETVAKYAADQFRAGHEDYSIEAVILKAWSLERPVPITSLSNWIGKTLVNAPRIVMPAAPLTANPSTPVAPKLTSWQQHRMELQEQARNYFKKPEEPVG